MMNEIGLRSVDITDQSRCRDDLLFIPKEKLNVLVEVGSHIEKYLNNKRTRTAVFSIREAHKKLIDIQQFTFTKKTLLTITSPRRLCRQNSSR